MNPKIFNILELLFFFLPIKKDKILFISFEGLFNDNPYHIFNYIHRNELLNKKFKLIWVLSKKRLASIPPKHVKFVEIYTFNHLFHSRTSEFIIDNGAGYKNIIKSKSIFNFLYFFYKLKKQFNISTWHGTPFKRIGIKIPNTSSSFSFSTSDILISNSKFTSRVFKESFPHIKNIVEFGSPRNDFLLNTIPSFEIKSFYRVNNRNLIVLYAPTFRNDKNNDFVKDFISSKANLVISELEKKFGTKISFIYRYHQISENSNNISSLNFLNGNLIQDMNTLLKEVDILITDFSGALLDFSLMKKPFFLYASDAVDYISKERGLNIDINAFFPISTNIDQLQQSIVNFDIIKHDKSINRMHKEMGLVENGKSIQSIIHLINLKNQK
jgi:CDP-glycerol glycerophosphotransferase